MAKERRKRVVLANPEEPRAGDYAYGLYDKAHPIYGDSETVNRMKKSLKGLRGEDVTMTFRGEHIDDSGRSRKFAVKRSFTLNKYTDVFGPGSAFASAIHYVRDKYSEETLVVRDFIVEESSGDDDSEYDEE